MKFIISLFILHIILLISMFDVYFQTPIIEGIEPAKNDLAATAKRLALFVGDGLRADTFYGPDRNFHYTPYLRKMVKNGASWGISHTRVPTESRPGHVAIIAGFYEDPSSVFKGWKENPVPFDSVFNQSTATFSWGSPDIVPIFSHETSNPNISWYSYSKEEQDFSGKNMTAYYLNSWVYDNFYKMIQTSYVNSTLNNILNQEGLILFFHLLGIDVAGHTRKPNSDYYRQSINHTDMIVEDIVKLMHSYYKDSGTAYIFTSDHGMTDWGSHGAGSESETKTPLVAWGSGIKVSSCFTDELKGSNHHSCSKDINQADIAVLISLLLGNSIPVHSIGVAPLEYLDLDDKQKSLALFTNAKQLLNQFNKKECDVKSSVTTFLFTSYLRLQKNIQLDELSKVKNEISGGNFSNAIKRAKAIINDALKGTEYYHRYFQNFKLLFLSLTFLGLLAVILSETTPYFVYSRMGQDSYEHITNGSSLDVKYVIWPIVMLLILAGSLLPTVFILYLLMPFPAWTYACINNSWVKITLSVLKTYSGILQVILYVCGTQIIFWSFFHRWALSLLMLTIMFWPFLDSRTATVKKPVKILWVISSISLAIFPLLPTVGSEPQIYFIAISAFIWYVFGGVWFYLTARGLIFQTSVDYTLPTKFLLVLPTFVNIISIHMRFLGGEGLTAFNQVVSYASLAAYILLMFLGPGQVLPSFISVAYSLGISFLLFCSGHECFFPIALSFNTGMWILFEMAISSRGTKVAFTQLWLPKNMRKIISADDIRRCFFYIFYIVLSFFGIGNVDSLNSFDLAWIRGFVVVFNPFLMTALILMKTVIPFIIVACAFRIIMIESEATVHKLFLIVLFFCDTLGLQFLFYVRNEGSWLDIGKSISHYVIVEVTTLLLIILYWLSGLIIRPRERIGLPL